MSNESPIAAAVAQLPARDSSSPFAQERDRLKGVASPAVPKLGTPFPDPDLLDAHGAATSISLVRAGRPAVVILYRGAWCPYCNIALRTYRDELGRPLKTRGIELIAISPQGPDGSLRMQEKHDLDFAVLSDTGNQIARSLGVLTPPSDVALHAQLSHGLDLTQINADGTADLPMPTVAIIDAAGLLAWIDVHPDYSTRTEPHQVMSALDNLDF